MKTPEKEFGIDCMKYRKSTHLASVDVDAIIAEKKECILTIKQCYYAREVDVNGKKTDGYFIQFVENVPEMLPNSTNRKAIADLIKEKFNCSTVESRNIAKWEGLEMRLIVDDRVSFGRDIVSGIRVDRRYKMKPKKTIEQAIAEFHKVNSRDSFVATMEANRDFLQNDQILSMCKDLSTKYPKN